MPCVMCSVADMSVRTTCIVLDAFSLVLIVLMRAAVHLLVAHQLHERIKTKNSRTIKTQKTISSNTTKNTQNKTFNSNTKAAKPIKIHMYETNKQNIIRYRFTATQ